MRKPRQKWINLKLGEDSVRRTGISGEDAETVVPEAAGHQETAVDGGDETVGTQPHFLREIVTQVTAGQVAALIGHRRCKNRPQPIGTRLASNNQHTSNGGGGGGGVIETIITNPYREQDPWRGVN